MYKSILVPVDLSHDAVAPRILAVARLLAGGHGRITLLTVVEPAPAYVMAQIPEEVLAANREHTRTALDALAAREGFPGQAQIRHGAAAATEILAEAERIGAEAIILGSHRPDLSDYLLGSTAARVVRHARCTVVVERSVTASAP